MNTIQKFKQGGGGWAGFYTVGNVPRHVASKSPAPTRKRYVLNPTLVGVDPLGLRGIERNGVSMFNPKSWFWYSDNNASNIQRSTVNRRSLVSRYTDKPTQSSSNQHVAVDKSTEDMPTKTSEPQTGGSNTNATNTNVGRGSKTSQSLYYTSKYKGKVPKIENLNSKDDVSNFQEKYLKNYYTPGKYVADGIWGDNTQAAYDRYLATLAQNVQPTAASVVETPVVETPVVTPKVEVPVTVQEYRPGSYNTEGYIPTAPTAGLYTNVNELYDYIINNPASGEAMLFNNAYGNLFNRELFDRIMNQQGISGRLGRRDTKRLNGLFDLLKQIGTEGSNERNDFIKTINSPAILYNRNGGLLSKNPVQRFKLKRSSNFFKY